MKETFLYHKLDQNVYLVSLYKDFYILLNEM